MSLFSLRVLHVRFYYSYFSIYSRHTLRLVLRADWKNVSKATKTHLSTTLTRIIADLTHGKRFFSILPQCRVLESVINDPWEHTVLKKIFQDDIVDIDGQSVSHLFDNSHSISYSYIFRILLITSFSYFIFLVVTDLIDYFHFENGKVIVIRLEILLESKCEEFASRLSKACLMTFNLTDPLELELNQDEVDYITDIYFCSLYRAKNTKDIIAEVMLSNTCIFYCFLNKIFNAVLNFSVENFRFKRRFAFTTPIQ